MKRSTPPLKVLGFVAGCVLAALWVLVHRGSALAPPGLLAVWLLACIVGEAFWVKAPGNGTISMALALDIAALMVLGHQGGVEVIALSTLIAGIYPHRRAWYKVLFNVAQSTLAAGAALGMVDLLSSNQGFHVTPVTLWWPTLLLAGVAFFSVNTALVSCVISLSSGHSVWRAWRDNFGYPFELASSLAQVTVSGLLLVSYAQFGPWTLLFVLPIIVVLAQSATREANALRQATRPVPVTLPETLRPTG
jgi:hypothetical protein